MPGAASMITAQKTLSHTILTSTAVFASTFGLHKPFCQQTLV
jgi:hypothetical protein